MYGVGDVIKNSRTHVFARRPNLEPTSQRSSSEHAQGVVACLSRLIEGEHGRDEQSWIE